jgi:hypothetical protein
MLRRTGAVGGLGGLGGLATLLIGSLNLVELDDVPPRTVRFEDDTLMAAWPSEEGGDDGAPPECLFYNGSVAYESALCSHFVITRSASAPGQAFARAKRCAHAFDSSCVLSAEIGLAVPAAFLIHQGDAMMVMAPKLLPVEGEPLERRVRVHDPQNTLRSRTYTFNRSVVAEYMDGRSKSIQRKTFEGSDAYCLQLLRRSFTRTCWDALD